jgi:3-deoxy-D-manno-octulosonic-acid transferase
MRLLYSILLTLALPVLVLRLYLRSLKAPAYRRRIRERFWPAPMPGLAERDKLIWIHAVSVGEVAAAEPLIRSLLAQAPDLKILLTTMTPTGSDRARALTGDRLEHCYIPYDLPFLLAPFIRRLAPELLLLMETELWPNLLYCCARQNVKVMLANGRLSEKSARGYGRLPGLSRNMLQRIDCIAAQSADDAARFERLGADASKISVSGSLKFNVSIAAVDNNYIIPLNSLKGSGRPVLIAASTREGEEEKVLTAYTRMLQRIPELVLLLVPRHPERFEEVARMLKEREFHYALRSSNREFSKDRQVLLGDSMGEMSNYYDCATLAFVGGSLVDTGCQNVLEPAARGIAVLTGPSQFNFATICRQLEQSGALITVRDESMLAECCIDLLQDECRRLTMGAAGKALVAENQQALPRHLALLQELLQ